MGMFAVKVTNMQKGARQLMSLPHVAWRTCHHPQSCCQPTKFVLMWVLIGWCNTHMALMLLVVVALSLHILSLKPTSRPVLIKK